jgi:methionyl-tRNA synthetase
MDKVNAMVAQSKDNLTSKADNPPVESKQKAKAVKQDLTNQPLVDDPISAEIQFDEFAKIDLRIAKIIKAEHVEKSRQAAQA